LKINNILKDKFNKLQLSAGFKKYFVNTSWLFFERIIGMAVSLLVGVYVARYLGPANFGLLSYAGSFVGLFAGIATLGLDNIVVRELVKDEKRRDELLGTTFLLKVIGAVLAIGMLFIAIRFTDNDNFTNLLIFIIAIGTIFQSFNVIKFYFQSKVLSKYTVFAQVFSTVLCAIIKLLLIYFNMGLIYFATVTLLQSIILASGFIVMYIKQKSSLFKWRIKFDLAKRLLNDSWPLMLAGITISIYMKIDQVMIKNMLDTKALGNYAVAVRLTEVWYFIPMAITNSLFPAIINAKKISEELYYQRLQKLYDLMVRLAVAIALPMTFLSDWGINLLFGSQYNQAGSVLMIYVWGLIPVGCGIILGKFYIIENYNLDNLFRNVIGALLNIILNYFLIKNYSIEGAAIASVISFIYISFIHALIRKHSRRNFICMLKSLLILKIK